MPDELEPGPEGAPDAGADAGGASTEPVVATEPTGAPDDPFDTGAESFERAYVERIRGEAAEHRTKLKPYEEALGGFNDDERQAILDMAKLLGTDPAKAADWMEQVVKGIRGDQPPAPEVAPAPVGGDQPLTRADLDAIFGQREAAERDRQVMQEVYAELNKVGLDPESKDPVAAAEAIVVMKVAAEVTAGDIAAAHKLVIEDRKQAIIDEFVASKSKDAKTPGAGPIGGTPSGERQRPAGMTPLEWSKAQTLERLAHLG